MFLQRHYVDRSVQTSPTLLAHAYALMTADVPVQQRVPVIRASDDYLSSSSDNVQSTPSSSQFETADSHSCDGGPLPPPPSSPYLVQRPRFIRKKAQQIGYGRPRGIHGHANRTISHPEAVTLADHTMLPTAGPTMRVVSLPERPKPVPLDASSYSGHVRDNVSPRELYLYDANDYTWSRDSFSATSDAQNTPSPPSSPESSVLIIGNDVQLPRLFLRRRRNEESSSRPEDEGWPTWASSPPRPIPALHGPSSLPYARCPSGAEGTVIEAPDNLSEMIWGLGSKEEQFHERSRAAPDNLPTPTPKKPTSPRFQKPDIPPRMLKNSNVQKIPATSDAVHSKISFSKASIKQDSSQAKSKPKDTRGSQQPHRELGNTVPTYRTGSIGRVQTGSVPLAPKIVTGDSAILSTSLYTNIGLGLDWQPTAASHSLPTLNKAYQHGSDRLQPTATAFVPAHQRNLTSNLHVPQANCSLLRQNLPSRLISAMPAQQPHSQENLYGLPTPPTSVSPAWLPQFPQDNLMQSLKPSGALRQAVELGADRSSLPSAYNNWKDFYQPSRASIDYPARYTESQDLGPDSQAYQVSADVRSAIRRAQSPQRLLSVPKYLPSGSLLSSQASPSPPRLRPPPNTPVVPLPASTHSSTFSAVNPPSPTSPEPGLWTSSHQRPRSIPLARLMRRSGLLGGDASLAKDAAGSSPGITKLYPSSGVSISPQEVHASGSASTSLAQQSDLHRSFQTQSVTQVAPEDVVNSVAGLHNRDSGPQEVVTVNVKLPTGTLSGTSTRGTIGPGSLKSKSSSKERKITLDEKQNLHMSRPSRKRRGRKPKGRTSRPA